MNIYQYSDHIPLLFQESQWQRLNNNNNHFIITIKQPVELYGAQTTSTTLIYKSKDIIGVGLFESHSLTVQSALAEIKVLG